MTNRILILTAFVITLFNTKLSAQNYPNINKDNLFELIEKDNEHKFFTVFIFTNGCGGGYNITTLRDKLDSITNGKTKFIYAQSSRGNDRDEELEKAIAAFKLDKKDLYLIDDSKYKVTKKDSREQGMLFRNDLCLDCKFMTIGTVYKLIFDKDKNLLYHGLMGTVKQFAAILSPK